MHLQARSGSAPSLPAAQVIAVAGGIAVLGVAWVAVPALLAPYPFTAHMTTHMTIVAIGAPLLALGIAGTRVDPVGRAPGLFAPIPASMVELMAVWGWHAPAAHQAARTDLAPFIAEQMTFLAAGLLLWLAVLGGGGAVRGWRRASGVGALLFTSIHMTLLGALFALATRPFYAVHAPHGHDLADLHLGGAVMLIVGGASYLGGALAVLAPALTASPRLQVRAAPPSPGSRSG